VRVPVACCLTGGAFSRVGTSLCPAEVTFIEARTS
jgi:hypothetical protein